MHFIQWTRSTRVNAWFELVQWIVGDSAFCGNASFAAQCSAMSQLYMRAHMKFSEGSVNSVGERCMAARCCKQHARCWLGMAGAQEARQRSSPAHLPVAQSVIVWQVEVLDIPMSFLQLVLPRHIS